MKSVIKIPAGYDLKGIGGSVIRQYDWHGDTLQVWSTGMFNIKFLVDGEVLDRIAYPSGDSVLIGLVPDPEVLAKYLSNGDPVSEDLLQHLKKEVDALRFS